VPILSLWEQLLWQGVVEQVTVHSLGLVVQAVVVTARLPCVDWEQQDRDQRAVMGWPPPILMLALVVAVRLLTAQMERGRIRPASLLAATVVWGPQAMG
jgi:hypothetical protein